MKRPGKGAGVEGAKKQKRGGDDVAPFKETEYRTFKLVVEDKPLFVCPHFISQISPFFRTLCLGKFREGIEGKAELKDVTYDDVTEMLYVLGADFSKNRKEIEASNCVSMMRLADRWAIDILTLRCNTYIETTFLSTPTSISFTLELLLTCEELLVGEKILRLVASRLASFEPALLLRNKVNEKINDSSLCAAIFWATNNFWGTDSTNSNAHIIARDAHGQYIVGVGPCTKAGCTVKALRRKCRLCEDALCAIHAHDGYECPKRSAGASESSAVLAPMDSRFFNERTA